MGAYPNALYLLTGVCSALMVAFFIIWCVAYAVSTWWQKRRRSPSPRRPTPRPLPPTSAPPISLTVDRPRRYSTPPPYRPVSSRKERR